MKITIDKVGRLVIPRQIRERIGLTGPSVVEIEIEGSGIRIQPAVGTELREDGDLLVIPRSGTPVSDAMIRDLMDVERYGR